MSKQERGTRTRNALICSAAELFEQRGYVKTSLDEVSSGAGVSRGALHFHFSNKAAVAAAVESSAADLLHSAARTALLVPGSALQVLTDISHALGHLMRRHVVARAGFQLNCDAALRSGPSLRQEWESCVQRYVGRAADNRDLAAAVPPEKLAATVFAATTGLEILGREDRQWLSHASLTGLWQLLLPMVATPHALAGLKPGGTAATLDETARIPGQFRAVGARPSDHGTDGRPHCPASPSSL